MIHKAAQIGLGRKLLQWLTNYLSNRQLKVVIHGQTSIPFAITAGVPQGSIIGSTLFLLYVCDIDQCLTPVTKLSMYADDTNVTLYHLVLPTDDPANPGHWLQWALDRLSLWGESWRIRFEPQKSQQLVISTRSETPALDPVTFGDPLLQRLRPF